MRARAGGRVRAAVEGEGRGEGESGRRHLRDDLLRRGIRRYCSKDRDHVLDRDPHLGRGGIGQEMGWNGMGLGGMGWGGMGWDGMR